MAGGNLKAEWRDRKRFGKAIEESGILSSKDSHQLAYDLAEIRDACRVLPRRIEKFIKMLEEKDSDVLRASATAVFMAGELADHLPAHIREAHRRIEKISDRFIARMDRASWRRYHVWAFTIELIVCQLEDFQSASPNSADKHQDLLQLIKSEMQALEKDLRIPGRKAKQDGLRRIREWRKRIVTAGYGPQFRQVRVTPVRRPDRRPLNPGPK